MSSSSLRDLDKISVLWLFFFSFFCAKCSHPFGVWTQFLRLRRVRVWKGELGKVEKLSPGCGSTPSAAVM